MPPVTKTKELVEIHFSMGVIPVASSVSPIMMASTPNDNRFITFFLALLLESSNWPAITPQMVCAPLEIKFIKLVLWSRSILIPKLLLIKVPKLWNSTKGWSYPGIWMTRNRISGIKRHRTLAVNCTHEGWLIIEKAINVVNASWVSTLLNCQLRCWSRTE